jgi:hypothetical protein
MPGNPVVCTGDPFPLVAHRNHALRYGDLLAGTEALSAQIAAATWIQPRRRPVRARPRTGWRSS